MSIGVVETPQASSESDVDLAQTEAIRRLLKEAAATSNRAVVSLPESQVYTRVVEMPYLQEPDLSAAIHWQAEQYIPVSLSDVVLKHQVLSLPQTGVPESKMTVLLVAAPNSLVSRYTAILTRAKLETVAIETEIFAVARALVATNEFSPTTLLVNFGTDTTTLAVLRRGDLSLTQSVAVGGVALSRVIGSELHLDLPQSEEYKRTYGLDTTKLEGRVAAVIKPVMDLVLTEVKRVVAFYETRPGSEPLKRMVMSGGTALLPGLVTYFTSNLGIEVQIGNPFVDIILSDKQHQAVYDFGALFSASVGLAMKAST